MKTRKKLDLKHGKLGLNLIKTNDDSMTIELTHYIFKEDAVPGDMIELTTGVTHLSKEEVAILREFINEKRGRPDQQS